MKLVLSTNHLGLGGSESYLLTVAEQLDRFGHEVVVYSPEPGAGVTVARERGITVVDESDLDDDYDAALVQDAGVSHVLAGRCPRTPQLFVAHSIKFDLQVPPQLDGAVAVIVAMNDRVEQRMRRLATAVDVVRLRQPIDAERFVPRAALPASPRRVLLLSNTPSEDRLGMVEAACAEAGLELARLGGAAGQETDVRAALAGAEIVIGYGRSVLEAMSMGRAAYVYDWHGGDGWVTAESYPALEADGWGGTAGLATVDQARLGEDLRGYSASMGPVNHDLVAKHHRASRHAEQLVELLERFAEPPSRQRGPTDEMARLVRLEWRARQEIAGLTHENGHLRDLLDESREREWEWEQKAHVREVESRRQAAEAKQAVEAEAKRVDDLARAYEATLSWRLTRPVRALTALLARLRGRRAG